MNEGKGVATFLRGVRFGRCEEFLLLGVIVLGALYPVLHGAIQSLVPVLCGWPANAGAAVTNQALVGKIACVLALVVILPLGARVVAGSWVALTRSSTYGVALAVAGISTATLTAYDTCTGFHAMSAMPVGCTCWLTALVAGGLALAATLLIFGGRALIALVRNAVVVILEAFCDVPRTIAPHFSRLCWPVFSAAGMSLARHFAGRAPPALLCVFD